MGYQAVQLESVSDSESISPALVQMKAPTGGQERQEQDNPQKGTRDQFSLLILPD